MSDNYLKEYLRKEHEEAGTDVDKGEEKDTKNMDDRIGYIHDAIKRIEAKLGTDKLNESEQKEAIEEGEKKQEDYDKEDEKDEKKDE